MIWVDAISLFIALITVALAALVDLRTLRIPNKLTFPAIALGLCLLLLRCALGYSILWALATCIVSYMLVFIFWKGGLWGGGDAKLVLAIFMLLSPMFTPFFYMAACLACLAFALFIRHFLAGALASDARLAAYALSPFILSSAVIAILWEYSRLVAVLAGMLAFAIAADLIADTYHDRERVPVDSAIGRRLAEDIYLQGGSVVRRHRHASAIRGLLDPVKGHLTKSQSLRREEVDALKKYVSEVDVYVQRPMGPSILIACVLAVLLGWAL